MASRRMRLKAVANISNMNRSGGSSSGVSGGLKSGRPLTPSPSPGPPSEASNSSFPNSPHSPIKHYHPIPSPKSVGSDERSRHASSSPRRPEPSASPSFLYGSPWSPVPAHSYSNTSPFSPALGNNNTQLQTSSEQASSPYFQPPRSVSPASFPQTSPCKHISENTFAEECSSSARETDLAGQTNEPKNFFSFPSNEPKSTDEPFASNLEKDIGSTNTANTQDTLRQRLQKGTTFNTTKYATVRKAFLTEYHRVEKPPDKDKLTILHFTFWNPPKSSGAGAAIKEDVNSENLTLTQSQPEMGEKTDVKKNAKETGVSDSIQADEQNESPDFETLLYKKNVPRVKVGPNGEIILDEQSLVIETTDSKRAKKQLEEMETVSGANFEVGSSGIYRHKKNSSRGRDWSSRETLRFYRALSSCGTDFSMMGQLFPKRSRAELKAKFKREDRKNPVQISQALSCQTFNPDDCMSSSEEEVENKHDNTEKSIFKDVEKLPLLTSANSVDLPIAKPAQRGKPNRVPAECGFPTEELLELVQSVSQLTSSLKQNKIRTQVVNTKQPQHNVEELNDRKLPSAFVKLKRDTTPTVAQKVRKSYTKKKRQKEDSKIPEKIHDQDVCPSPDILRFDAGDPLGYKVLATTNVSDEPNGVILLDAPNCETDPHQIFDLSSVLRKDSDTCSEDLPQRELSKPIRHVKPKARRPHPYRVPGPGTIHTESQPNPQLVDEIEIEISCD